MIRFRRGKQPRKAVVPGSTSEMLSLIGIEKRPVALALIPVALIVIWVIDHPDDDEAEDGRPAPRLSEAPQPPLPGSGR